ncbi:MAG: phytanoyl-CoA dioxygenase family protein [Lentisphaeria bacterium]|nr:phytanoyl-CoA dioxygenase family protein [Lentisphaeria bacterium]NQZ70283.1 phytanoyl-CoA dioxygenase family protein [Lentisphaeria bacterium]
MPSEIPYDCEPTLTDSQVIEFCRDGYIILDGVVDPETNQKAVAFLDENPEWNSTKICREDFFIDNVLKNPAAAGVARSLMGKDFLLPTLMMNHRAECPRADLGHWHRDGGVQFKNELNYLLIFYLPEETPKELGPPDILPGSQYIEMKHTYMRHYGNIKGTLATPCSAGTIIIMHHNIWHRSTVSTRTGIRNMLKYEYRRTTPPKRDWIVEADLDIRTKNFRMKNSFMESWQDCQTVAELFLWLCGYDDWEFEGAQIWPTIASYFPDPEAYMPGVPEQFRLNDSS